MSRSIYSPVLMALAVWVFAGICSAEPWTVVSKEHVVAYHHPDRFCGWPANGGFWMWGNEMAAAFEIGWWKDTDDGHHRDESRANEDAIVRSLDGGQTWTMEMHVILGGDGPMFDPPSDIDFTHPDFAYKAQGERFYISYDRGRNWLGKYPLATLGCGKLSTRTDYIVSSRNVCYFFSACEFDEDRAFAYRTTNAGASYEFLGWMGPDDETRSVMPSTVRLSDTKLISAMRRKRGGGDNWIDVYVSTNDGKNWQFLSKVADTCCNNGNPPAMIRMNDGRVVCAYGYRGGDEGIRAKVSTDEGQSWSPEIRLRDDGLNWDLGYPRMVQRPDGKLVTVYYYCTREKPQQFIGATIWELEGTTMTGGTDLNNDGAVNFLDFAILLEDEDIL